MKVSVKLFATLKDKAGTDCIDIDVPDGASIKELIESIAAAYPNLKENAEAALVAINQEFAFPDDTLEASDEIALFPPVSGGAEHPDFYAITADKLDLNDLISKITIPETGAVCMFSGTVRGVTLDSDGDLQTDHLVYEAYEPMAINKLKQVGDEIREKFPKVHGVAAVQTIGRREVGETTVLVACSSRHRGDGIFEAAQYGIDRLKEIVPVWKKEFGPDGTSWIEGDYHPTPDDVTDTSSD